MQVIERLEDLESVREDDLKPVTWLHRQLRTAHVLEDEIGSTRLVAVDPHDVVVPEPGECVTL